MEGQEAEGLRSVWFNYRDTALFYPLNHHLHPSPGSYSIADVELVTYSLTVEGGI